jgi:predicted Ser/Thr protein kinase
VRKEVIALFHEVADLSAAAREEYYERRLIPSSLRDELELLLRFDTESTSLTGRVAGAADEFLATECNAAESSEWGPYRVIRPLGQGGMGTVYLAKRADGEVEQQVAIKVVRGGPGLAAFQECFLAERQILATLNHPGIARLLDAGHTGDGEPYLVMEYIDGVAIDAYCSKLDLHSILNLFLLVCDAVSYAHRNLIVHRDLKPSNILIDAAGRPKLLDFGIAKIVDDAETTKTLVRILTPEYASPEQLRGEARSTATDIYSLGAVLYKLLTRTAPNPPDFGDKSVIIPASRIQPDIPRDIDFILRKTLRDEPEERYASADAFAGDIRAFLENRPVGARAGNAWYRTRKFLRRYWVPVTAGAVALTGLSVGLYIANRERIVAQQRFSQVRDLSNQVFKLDDEIRDLPGATKARHALVALSLHFLERLGREARGDKALMLEIGSAYVSVAEVQGVPGNSNLGELSSAEESLAKADAMIDSIVASAPRDRTALVQSAEIAHDRMIVADSLHRPDQALVFAQRAAARLESLLSLGAPGKEASDISRLYLNIALGSANLHRLDNAVRYAQRGVEIGRSTNRPDYVGAGLSVLSNALRLRGDLEKALEATQEARAFQEKRPDDFARTNNLIVVIWREGRILGEDDEINLNRPSEAIQAFQTAYGLADQLVQRDAADYGSRARFVAAAQDLGDILRHSDPVRALAVYDSGLRRSAEIENTESAHDRVRLLTGSSYPLRALHHTAESKRRIDTAFDLLRQMKAWPAQSIRPGEETGFALRALADYYGDTGRLPDAIATYRELLAKIMASNPTPDSDLRDANSISVIEAALAPLERQAGHTEAAVALDRGRRERWQRWDAKLPNNSFVRRRLAAIPPN